MHTITVHPCSRLEGEVKVQGAKNSVLPIMAAAVLNQGVTVLYNCPRISDVHNMAQILMECGCLVVFDDDIMIIDAKNADGGHFASGGSKKMRASILLMGSCLARFGSFAMPAPGGCAIGKRPVDYHLMAMESMGAEVRIEGDMIVGHCKDGLKGCQVTLPYPSVGATQNTLIAAVMANGTTVINNAAREPEIEDLCAYLGLLGCKISGAGSSKITLVPPSDFGHDVHMVMPADRIVAGTLLTACAITTGNIFLNNASYDRISVVADLLGATRHEGGIIYNKDKRPRFDIVISTGPYPEFPTDMQSVFTTLLSVSQGFSIIEETVFDTRFSAARQLAGLGANIRFEGNCAYIYGRRSLSGGTVKAADLRGGAALVLAGLAADGPVTVTECEHIDRGYENLAGVLRGLGADIT